MSRILVVTTLYPNEVQFRHGIFVETRLLRLIADGRHEAVVIAPVPWFPLISRRFSRYADYARVPYLEQRQGVTVYHPRYLVIPKIGMLLSPFFLYLATRRQLRVLMREGQSFDLIDAHYYYPDGVAAALLARSTGLPLWVTARGSDINVIARMRLPGAMVRWAAHRANASIAVSDALRRAMVALGIDGPKIHVLRNGVDLERFRPLSLVADQRPPGTTRHLLLSVGNLVDLKGHDLIIRALPDLPQCELILAGDGDLRGGLEQLARELRVEARVQFLGAVDQDELVRLYNAADMLVLASSREGMPNVVLEAMACDTPVVATAVGGVPEIMTSEAAGVMVERRDVKDIIDGIRSLLSRYPAHGATRRHAEAYSWEQTMEGLNALLAALPRGRGVNAG